MTQNELTRSPAIPKSQSLISPPRLIRMLEGFTSGGVCVCVCVGGGRYMQCECVGAGYTSVHDLELELKEMQRLHDLHITITTLSHVMR